MRERCPNAGKYGPEKLQVRTIFTQWISSATISRNYRSYWRICECFKRIFKTLSNTYVGDFSRKCLKTFSCYMLLQKEPCSRFLTGTKNATDLFEQYLKNNFIIWVISTYTKLWYCCRVWVFRIWLFVV